MPEQLTAAYSCFFLSRSQVVSTQAEQVTQGASPVQPGEDASSLGSSQTVWFHCLYHVT